MLKKIQQSAMGVVAKAAPNMMFDLVRKQMNSTVPFIRHVGVEIEEISVGAARARLQDEPHLKNHLGTAHAAAVYMLCETASGVAMAGAFVSVFLNIRPAVRDASIRYLKSGRGRLVADARIQGDPQELLTELGRTGNIDFAITVEASGEDGFVIATATYNWNIKSKVPV